MGEAKGFDWVGLVTAFTAAGGLAYAIFQSHSNNRKEANRTHQDEDTVISILEYYISQCKMARVMNKHAYLDDIPLANACKVNAEILTSALADMENIRIASASSIVVMHKVAAERLIKDQISQIIRLEQMANGTFEKLSAVIDLIQQGLEVHAQIASDKGTRNLSGWKWFKRRHHDPAPTA